MVEVTEFGALFDRVIVSNTEVWGGSGRGDEEVAEVDRKSGVGEGWRTANYCSISNVFALKIVLLKTNDFNFFLSFY